jgi:hypothetical protein
VNIQASANLLQFLRDVVMSQPYLIVIDADTANAGEPAA